MFTIEFGWRVRIFEWQLRMWFENLKWPWKNLNWGKHVIILLEY